MCRVITRSNVVEFRNVLIVNAKRHFDEFMSDGFISGNMIDPDEVKEFIEDTEVSMRDAYYVLYSRLKGDHHKDVNASDVINAFRRAG